MRLHIFIDAENVNPKLFQACYKNLAKVNQIIKIDIFGKSLPKIYGTYSNINFVQSYFGKNSADTFMTAYIVKAIYEEPLTDSFVILTQDKDFAPAIKTVTDNNKECILVTEKDRLLSNIKSVGVNMKYFNNMAIDLNSLNSGVVVKTIVPPEKSNGRLDKYDLSKTCFLVNGVGEFIEVPFSNGMEFIDFNLIMQHQMKRIRKGFSNSIKIWDILAKSYLKIIDDKVYFDIEELDKEEQ